MTFLWLVLFVALGLYVLLGGADFGAGLYELLTGNRGRVDKALSPVWEANHVWLILILVLLSNVLPGPTAQIIAWLHIPLGLALLGIVARGTAFTFRHYDPAARPARAYTVAFRAGSVLTPLFLGMSFAATGAGTLRSTGTFAEVYVWPWLTGHGLLVGVFWLLLCFHFAVVLLLSEDPHDAAARRLGFWAHAAVVLAGAALFAQAALSGVPWAGRVLAPGPLLCVGAATACAAGVGTGARTGRRVLTMVAAGGEALFIIGGQLLARWPVLCVVDGREVLAETAGPVAPALIWALGVGLALVVPALGALFWVFKAPRPEGTSISS